jgi:hypothetical protein
LLRKVAESMSGTQRLIVQWSLGKTVRLADNREVPATFSAVVQDQDPTAPAVAAEFMVLDGVPQCRELRFVSREGGREIRAADCKRARVEDWLEDAVASVAESGSKDFLYPPTEKQRAETVRQVRVVRRESRRRITDNVLQEVAEVYRANLDDKPTEAVAKHFEKSHRTAALYVKLAREAGHLGKATKGKAGER